MCWSSTRRAPASRPRSCAGSSRRPRRGSSTSPATRRRSRPTRPSWWRRATPCAACARSTCSPRRPTSSAWRCSSASDQQDPVLPDGVRHRTFGSNDPMRVRTRSLLAAGLSAAALSVLPATAGADGFPLVGWWPMNEGSGQVIHDWSVHGNNGTLGNSAAADDQDPAWIRGVFSGSALSFGGNDMVRIPDSTSLEPANVTVAAWIRGTSSPGQYKYVVGKGANGCLSGSYGLYTSDNGGRGLFPAGGAPNSAGPPGGPAPCLGGERDKAPGALV